MCWKRSRLGEPIPPSVESDIFEHFALEVFRNLFAFDAPSVNKATGKPAVGPEDPASAKTLHSKTTLHKVEEEGKDLQEALPIEQDSGKSNATIPIGRVNSTSGSTSGHHRRNSTRNGVNSDLSKYGPWGYLMLGMLLCGGALLICGLWGKCLHVIRQGYLIVTLDGRIPHKWVKKPKLINSFWFKLKMLIFPRAWHSQWSCWPNF